MCKIIYYLFFFSSFIYSQIEINKTKDIVAKIKKEACEKPFHLKGKYDSYNINATKFGKKFYFQQNDNETNTCLLEMISNGKTIWHIDYDYEEINIYSLTENEKKHCFFIDKITNEIEEWNLAENLLLGRIKNNWIILNESYEDINYKIIDKFSKIEANYKISGAFNLTWIEFAEEIVLYLPKGSFEFDIDNLSKKNYGFEIIDFR